MYYNYDKYIRIFRFSADEIYSVVSGFHTASDTNSGFL
jgi:hypothetical protein